MRGKAYLMLHDGNHATAEFQKFIDHRGLVRNAPIAMLARLALARAYARQGDTAKAQTGFQEFLTAWKDADPDVPVLQQAKAEYARLLRSRHRCNPSSMLDNVVCHRRSSSVHMMRTVELGVLCAVRTERQEECEDCARLSLL